MIYFAYSSSLCSVLPLRNDVFNLTRSIEGGVNVTLGVSLYDEMDVLSSIVSVGK
jgi:hypothetical protein